MALIFSIALVHTERLLSQLVGWLGVGGKDEIASVHPGSLISSNSSNVPTGAENCWTLEKARQALPQWRLADLLGVVLALPAPIVLFAIICIARFNPTSEVQYREHPMVLISAEPLYTRYI